ncbi:hypothetical protein C8J56DRAFT_420560 [Mycena floridula]|nr:hypothetical protein C8J56DRAFT_420560 [Mycena floridula]
MLAEIFFPTIQRLTTIIPLVRRLPVKRRDEYSSCGGTAAKHRRARGYMPAANVKLYGRDKEIEEIVRILTAKPASSESKRSPLARIFTMKSASSQSKRVRFALLGAGGQGKTALALKVIAHPAIRRCYSMKNSIWVPCEEANSPTLLLDVLLTSLAINKDTHNPIEDILEELRQTSQPIILLLDNFETPWNSPGGRGAVERILQDITQFPHVALFVTMRATVAPGEDIDWEEMRIQPLDPKSSQQLFTAIHRKARADVKLSELLEILGHMALAVKLMARYGKNTGCTVEELISRYTFAGTAMLGPTSGSDPQNSVSVSICMSLESTLVKDELNAGWLLNIIAMLPSGTTIGALEQWWAWDLENLGGALRALLEASLLEHGTTTYFVLPVVRSYLLNDSHQPPNIHDSMVRAACKFLQQHHSHTPGDEPFQHDMKARAIEEINLQFILLETTKPSPDAIEALVTLAWHQYRIRPRTEVIRHALKLAGQSQDQKLVAQACNCYAANLHAHRRLEESLKQNQLARAAFLAASMIADAASVLLNIANISFYLDPSFDEIPLIEQAQRELESTDQDTRHARKLMVRCLWRFGRAYLRRYKHSNAIQHLTNAWNSCDDLPYERSDCAVELALAYHGLHQLDEAEKWAVLAVDDRKQIGGYLGHVLRRLGLIHISNGKYNQAIECLVEGLDNTKDHRDQSGTADTLLELGRAFMKTGEGDEARASFIEALTNYRDLEGSSVVNGKMICQYYLERLDDSTRVPTSKENDALDATWHHEDTLPS